MTVARPNRKDLPERPSLQEYFDHTVAWLRMQESRCTVDGGCSYRDVTDPEPSLKHAVNACAVGIWIPDELYDSEMEGRGVLSLANKWPSLEGTVWPAAHRGLNLAFELQNLHDDPCYRVNGLSSEGEDHACGIASQFGLVYTAPQQVTS